MGIGLAILLLILAWRWRIRDLIKRVLIVLLVPVLHVYFLRRAENPIAFQQWTLVVVGVLFLFCLMKAIVWVKNTLHRKHPIA